MSWTPEIFYLLPLWYTWYKHETYNDWSFRQTNKQPDGETDNSSVAFVNGGTLKKILPSASFFDFLKKKFWKNLTFGKFFWFSEKKMLKKFYLWQVFFLASSNYMGTLFVRKSFFEFEKSPNWRFISKAKFEIYLRVTNFQRFYKKIDKVLTALTKIREFNKNLFTWNSNHRFGRMIDFIQKLLKAFINAKTWVSIYVKIIT